MNQNKVFIYWDNSNIYISAAHLAAEWEGGDARSRLRIDFRNLLRLAHADRKVHRAVAGGSVPPEMRHVWNRLEREDVQVLLLERGQLGGGEQGVDQLLQTQILRDALDHNGDPGIAVLLTGDGSGFYDGIGFHADMERMHRKGWRIEILSWRHSCSRRMQQWAQDTDNCAFIALDDYYRSITYLEAGLPGRAIAEARYTEALDLTRRG